MKDLAPHIYRQRLLIEGNYARAVDVAVVEEYFEAVLSSLKMTAAGEALINSSLGQGKPQNQGIEAFLPLIESGIVADLSRFALQSTCRQTRDGPSNLFFLVHL